jgi:hypothetical protein
MKPSCATEPFDRHIAVNLKGTFNERICSGKVLAGFVHGYPSFPGIAGDC